NKIIERVREPFLIDGHEVFTGCSIGVSVYPTCGDDAKTLLKNAEASLVRAKAIGRNSYQYFTVEMNKLRLEQMQMEFELRQAVEQKQWRIQYLPVAHFDSRAVVACEVRLSWVHPKRGEIALETFLAAAEEAGLAADIFRWLWMQALQRFESLESEAKDKVRLILPMSPAILLQDGGVDWVITSIAQVGLASDQIYLELPETYYTVRLGQHGEVLNELCRNGFNLILDSFGTGYAPLSLLKDVPYSLVKLSDSFVSVCDISKSDQAIIKGVIDMAHQLGMQVMAAAVDSEAQQQFLQAVACDWLTGEAVERALDETPQKLDAMGLYVMPG
ncbi:MAG: GGDEF domain-containing protein, partial [Ketobacter sp.]